MTAGHVKRFVIAAILGMVAATIGSAPAADASPPPTSERTGSKVCDLPSGGGTDFGSASPEQQALDPAAVQRAVDYATTHLRLSVQIFRNNCRVATGPLNSITGDVPLNVWSSTKAVTSMLTGIAADQRKLSLDDRVGKHLPKGPNWGDAAHRAITIRQLLTQTSGLRESSFAEVASLGLDPHVAQEALAQPLTHEPGTHFAYGQRGPDLLAYVVQRAVGMDLQDFAQRYLFDPIGIPRTSYFWLRDRSGNSYGFAHLFIGPNQFAKLGLLMQNDGVWNGRRVISSSYVRQAGEPTRTNGCYGFLFWTNGGEPCTSANIPGAQTVDHRMIPSAPTDLYSMIGFLHQNNFIIPSLDMTVTWTGAFGDTTTNLPGLVSASPAASDLYHNFFRILMSGVRDANVPDPGPYTSPPQNYDINPLNIADPRVLLTDLFPNARCNVLLCEGGTPTTGPVQNAQAILDALAALLRRP